MVLIMADNKIPKITINGKKDNDDFNKMMLETDKKINLQTSLF